METIEHRHVKVNGITMHIAEKGKGQGPVILFLHGFPELWYTWRHQILDLSSRGYHAIAPDLRGYGDSEAPPLPASYTMLHLAGDLVGLIDYLGVDQVFLVAHDWGAMIGWQFCLLRPDRVKAFVSLSVPFKPRNPKMKPVALMRAFLGEEYYMCRFQEPGYIESEIARCGTAKVLKKILGDKKPGPPMMPKENPFGIFPGVEISLPPWLSEEDINYCATKFNQRGFTGGLNYYRALDLNWELTAAWTNVQVQVPVKFVVGDADMVYTSPGIKEYVHGGGFKKDVPLLDEVVVMEGVGHFINQEKAQEISSHIYDFFNKF
ncbi:hypothetical protein ACFE04_007339 [Oxalis oulophora]